LPTHDLTLQASANCFSRTLSFTKGARERSQPALLYRERGAWELTDLVGLNVNVPTPASAEVEQGLTIEVGGGVAVDIASVTLSYFIGPLRSQSTLVTPRPSGRGHHLGRGSA
jgi:hypothetical protein